ncbi:LOW QUALITY PROTEIN: RAD51-associated protein 2 [Pithys albifrons albifrons]|uniref:LOW QUALITY PROTEIN: RAD51-associated protein 2 n=1 Tax=Pithys albifrons albifrons TaxID=3385563 RepID=UPI003A5CB0FD
MFKIEQSRSQKISHFGILQHELQEEGCLALHRHPTNKGFSNQTAASRQPRSSTQKSRLVALARGGVRRSHPASLLWRRDTDPAGEVPPLPRAVLRPRRAEGFPSAGAVPAAAPEGGRSGPAAPPAPGAAPCPGHSQRWEGPAPPGDKPWRRWRRRGGGKLAVGDPLCPEGCSAGNHHRAGSWLLERQRGSTIALEDFKRKAYKRLQKYNLSRSLEIVKRSSMPKTLIFLKLRTVSAKVKLIFVSMKSTCSKRFLSASPDDTEWYLYAKQSKIESDQKSREKEEQPKLQRSTECGNRNQTSPHTHHVHHPLYLSELQNHLLLEKQSCDTATKTFCSQRCSNGGLSCRITENELPTKKWSPENGDQNTTEDDISLSVHGQLLETELLGVSSAADSCQNLQVLNPPEVQQNNSIEQNNKRNEDNEIKQISPVTSLKRHSFQMELLRQKSLSDKRWQQYQLLQVPFLCGTSSVFSHTENKKNNFLKNVCSAEDKNCSSNSKENSAERGNKEKNNSLYIIPTLKPFKSMQELKIPNFQLPTISNKINSKTSSTNLSGTDLKSSEGQPSLLQSKQIHGGQKVSETGKQKLQNDKNGVRALTVGSEFKEKNNSPIKKPEHSNLAAKEVSGIYFRGDSTDIECNKIFAENDLEDKMLENSAGDDDQKSKMLIYISAKNVQNEKCVSCNDLLQRMGRKSSNENTGTFHVQTSIPVTTEELEENKLDLHCDVRNSNSNMSLYEVEPKLSTKEILDFQRYATKSIISERSCPRIIVQNFPDKRVSRNIFRAKELFKSKFSFQNILFGLIRTWTESFHEDLSTCQDWFNCCDTLNERCDAQELVKSTVNRNHNDKIFICLLAVISNHLKGELLKTILSSFSSSTDTLLAAEGKSVRVEKQPLRGRKENQLNSCTDDTSRQTTKFLKENYTYPGFVSSKFTENIALELQNECQRRCFSRPLGDEEYTCLQIGALFHNQKSRLCKGRHVRKHHLLSRKNEAFSAYLRSVSHKTSMKKQILSAKCLILLQGTPDCSSLDKMYCCNITKIQYLMGANLRFWRSFPAHSKLEFKKLNSKSINEEILATTVKQEKEKPNTMLRSSFHVERFKAFSFVLCENKKHKTSGYRNCLTSTDEVTNSEVTYTMKEYAGASSCINADGEERANSKELQINYPNFFSKKSYSIFDTYEKIHLPTEDFDQIPAINEDSCMKKELYEESAVISPKEVHCLPVKSNDVSMLLEQSKATTEKYNSLLLLDRQTKKHEYCKELCTYSPHLANKKVEDQNTYLKSENLLPSSSDVCQSVTLSLDSSSLVNRGVSGDGHGRSSSSAGKLKETIPAMVQYPSTGRPSMTDTCLQLQAKETAQFSLQGQERTNKTGSLEPATLKEHPEYVKEQEERNDEQMHVTNESQCETVMKDLIMSHSEDESQTFIAGEEELKMHLSVMNNGCLEDVKNKYLPLENKLTHEFELKRKFDLVLEELHMFHKISNENENNLSSLETNSLDNYWELNNSEEIDENVTSVSQKKICISSPIRGTIEKQNITDSNENSLNEEILNEKKDQEVSKEYFISRLSSEVLLYSPVAEGAPYRNPYTWDPAFLPCTFFKEQSYNLQKEGGYFLSRDIIRVQPLKTCKGPIRIGLSRRARPKQLHPYLK